MVIVIVILGLIQEGWCYAKFCLGVKTLLMEKGAERKSNEGKRQQHVQQAADPKAQFEQIRGVDNQLQ